MKRKSNLTAEEFKQLLESFRRHKELFSRAERTQSENFEFQIYFFGFIFLVMLLCFTLYHGRKHLERRSEDRLQISAGLEENKWPTVTI